MRKTQLLIFSLLLFCFLPMVAQNIMIDGTVTDASTSESLIGVSVVVKGTTSGTVTDFNGNYKLSVPANATLVFGYIGYASQEIAVKNRKSIRVAMVSDAQKLEEVVVVGASMKKSDLTGAVGSVSSKVLEEKPVTSINQALEGRTAGVLVNSAAKPGDDSSIKIRGINTINGATDPIYVVDGIVLDNFGGGFNSINLDDVASIEVLKDASSTALYGSRGANGVILITTKRGEKGEGKITYDGWMGVRSYANMPKTMNSRQLFELRRDAAINSYKANYPSATDADLNAFIQNRVMTAYNPTNKGGGFVFGQYELDAYNNPNFKDYDWMGAVSQDGVEQNHVLNFTGGSDKGSFYLSFGYSNQQGMIKKLSDTKYTGRINADYAIKPWLKVGTNTSYVRSQSQIFSDDGVFDRARGANPMLAISQDILTLNYGDFYDQNYFNPLNTLKINNDRTRNRLITSDFLNLNPIKGLNIRTTLSMDYFNESDFKYVPNDIQEAIRYAAFGETTHNRDERTMLQWDNTATYEKSFGLHRFNAVVGYSISETNRDYTNVVARGYQSNIFSYYNLGASDNIANRSVGSDFTTSALMSYIGRINYNYAGKYYLTATTRYDGSSKFAAGNRWGFFPSFSAAWNVAEEGFMKDQSIFDQLKVRLGYGLAGNQNIADYSYVTPYYASVTQGNTTYVPSSQIGNKDLKWEGQKQFNFGLDMGFLKNRIHATADVFSIKNQDLLMTRAIFPSSGFSTEVVNVGAIENKGAELTVDVKAISTKDFQWNVSANISTDKNKVTQLYGKNDYILNYDGDRNLQKEGNLFVGQSRNTIYIWKTGGIAQESDMDRLSKIDWGGRTVRPGDLYPLDVNGDNKIDDKDRVIVGSPDPKFYGGFSTDVTYKGISLNAVFNYSVGGKKLSYLYETLIGSTGKGLASVDLLDRWTPENTGAKFPRPMLDDPSDKVSYNTFSASNMDFSVQDASYLRLSTLTLSYTFPQKLIHNLLLSNVRVYTTASNLFCLTPYKGYDPETGDWYPPTRMFVFGLNLSF
ncbi:MAG: TonB-dependent receptor [Bacteroidota bacterium]|nr:TonB-dependent receptor [Bacteroidota bacterium]